MIEARPARDGNTERAVTNIDPAIRAATSRAFVKRLHKSNRKSWFNEPRQLVDRAH
jgi:hypothetical protein